MGTVVIDAGVLIGLLEDNDSHHSAAVSFFRRVRQGPDVIGVPASALSEALVGKAIGGGAAGVSDLMALLNRLPATTLDIDVAVAKDAALIRAAHRSLRLPDALVIAAARVHQAVELVTTDRRWPTKRALKFPGRIVVL